MWTKVENKDQQNVFQAFKGLARYILKLLFILTGNGS